MDNYSRYCDIFKENLNLQNEEELKSASFDTTPGWDSFIHMQLVVEIEGAFNIQFEKDDIMAFRSFEDGINILKKRGVIDESGLFLNTRATPNHIALADEYGVQYTYAELNELAENYKRLMPIEGLVLIPFYRDIETVAFYYAMLTNKTKVMLTGTDLTREQFFNLIDQYEPKYIWKPIYPIHNSRQITNVLFMTSYNTYEINSDLAILISTSGSTGSPKYVRLSYENLLENAANTVDVLKIGDSSVGVTSIPLHFCFGLTMLHIHWYCGAKICITERSIIEQEFWTLCEKEGVTLLFTIPYHYVLFSRLNYADVCNTQLKTILAGGGKIPSEELKMYSDKFAKRGIHQKYGYGQTEGTTVLAVISGKDMHEKEGSVGCTLIHTKAFIENADENGIGELVFEGKTVSLGYAENKDDLCKGDENKGVLHTGDLARIDEDGFIFIKGRIKRFVKILGVRTSLDDVELSLNKAFPDNEIVCTGEDDNVRIYCTNKNNQKDITDYCKRNFKIPLQMIHIKQIDNIPRGENGKIQYARLKR